MPPQMFRLYECFSLISYIIGLLVIQHIPVDGVRLTDVSVSKGVYTTANSSAEDGVRRSNNSRFSLRPPPYSVKDAGAKAVFECAVNDIYADFTAVWQTPGHIVMKSLGNMSSLDIVMNGTSSDIFITESNTLVFQRLEKSHVGLYSCVINDLNGSSVAVAKMRLYVIDISNINYARKTLYGVCGAVLMSLLIFALYFVINRRKRAKGKRTRTTFELNATHEDNGQCLDPILAANTNN